MFEVIIAILLIINIIVMVYLREKDE